MKEKRKLGILQRAVPENERVFRSPKNRNAEWICVRKFLRFSYLWWRKLEIWITTWRIGSTRSTWRTPWWLFLFPDSDRCMYIKHRGLTRILSMNYGFGTRYPKLRTCATLPYRMQNSGNRAENFHPRSHASIVVAVLAFEKPLKGEIRSSVQRGAGFKSSDVWILIN